MGLETVEVSVYDTQVVPALVDDVVVRVFDETGTTLITEATTGSVLEGKVQVTLSGDDPTPIRYQLRFFVNGGSISSPQYIDVYSPPTSSPTGANNFTVTATMFELPSAVNPRLCRVSGYVWGPDGRIRGGVDIHFIPQFNPLVVDGYGVMGERVSIHSDSTGFLSVDLLRCGIYDVMIEGHENVLREIYVPDRSSLNIFHLLFPIVVNVNWDPAGPWSLAAGTSLEVTPEILANDFRTLTGTADADVQYATDDPSIASVTVGTTSITITGYAAGTTTLRVTRRDSSIVYIPDPGIDDGEITITVT